MSTYSSDLRIELIANGAQAGTWGTTTNDTWAYVIDPAISGFQTVAVASASQALTYVNGSTATASANQAVYASLAFTTGLGTSFSVYAPPVPKQYIIWNNSAQSMTLYNSSVIGNTTPAGTGVTIPAGNKIQVFSNGTNFYSVEAANLTGTLAIANGGTGQTTQQAAINALAGAQTSGYYLRGNGTNVSMSAIQAGDVPTLNQNTTGQAGLVANSVTFNNGGSGDASGAAFNGSASKTISYNTVGAPSTTGTNASGTWNISISGNAATATNATNATNPASGGSFITSSNIGSQSVSYATTAGNGGVTSVNGQTGAVSMLAYGSIGSYVIAGSTSMGTNNTLYDAGTTVAGSTLVRSLENASGGNSQVSLNALVGNGGTMTGSTGEGQYANNVNLGLTGTWRSMTAAYITSSLYGQYPMTLFVRIS